MTPQEAARRWQSVWQEAWPARYHEAVLALYAEDAVHRSTPFRPAHEGIEAIRAYFADAFADETAPAQVFFADPLVVGRRAVMEWWALTTETAGPSTIAGIAVADFDPAGRITRSRDYWHSAPGHHHPHEPHT